MRLIPDSNKQRYKTKYLNLKSKTKQRTENKQQLKNPQTQLPVQNGGPRHAQECTNHILSNNCHKCADTGLVNCMVNGLVLI